MIQPYLNQKIRCWFRWFGPLSSAWILGSQRDPNGDPMGWCRSQELTEVLRRAGFHVSMQDGFRCSPNGFGVGESWGQKPMEKHMGKPVKSSIDSIGWWYLIMFPHIPETQLAILGIFTPQTLAILLIFLKFGHWGDERRVKKCLLRLHTAWNMATLRKCDSKVPPIIHFLGAKVPAGCDSGPVPLWLGGNRPPVFAGSSQVTSRRKIDMKHTFWARRFP